MGSGQPLRVLGELLRQHLDGDFTAQVGILSTVDFAHAAFTDLLKNLVMANGRTDHRTPPHCNVVAFNAKSVGGEKAIKFPSILGGVGWKGVEWVWRGYNFGYKTPILAFSGEMGFS